jgi:hypothetical protein
MEAQPKKVLGNAQMHPSLWEERHVAGRYDANACAAISMWRSDRVRGSKVTRSNAKKRRFEASQLAVGCNLLG